MIPQSYIDYYGDQTRWFIGVVVDINDPYQLGRVRVRIFGIHGESTQDIPLPDLPWAQTVIPVTAGGSSGLGATIGIQVKAQVFGIFLDGKLSQMPVVLGSMTQFEVPSSTQREQAKNSGRSRALTEDFIVDGVILDPNLVDAYNQSGDNLETRIVIAMQFLLDAGIANPEAAAGVVGNLIGESNLVPDGPKGKVGEEGIAQWNPEVGRLQRLKNFTKTNYPGKSYLDFFVQLNFLVWDMKNGGVHACWNTLSDKNISHTFNPKNISEQRSDTNATYLFLRVYERPKDSLSKLAERQEYAQNAWDAYQESKRLTAAYAASSGGAI